jgi:hypothetical protein
MAIFNEKGHRVIQSSNRSATNIREYRHGNINTGPVGTGAQQTAFTELELIKNPYAFRQISYPTDITTNPARGHYMLFYVNVQNKTKYKHIGHGDNLEVGNQIANLIQFTSSTGAAGQGKTKTTNYTQWNSAEGKHEYDSVKAGGIGSINSGDVTYLAKGRPAGHEATAGMEKWHPTTTRITDSIALYLPANISSDLTAQYDDASQGLIGMAMASGFDFKQNWDEDDFEGAANALKGFVSGMGVDTLTRGLAGLADMLEAGANTYGGINKYFSRAVNPYMEVIFEHIEQRKFRYRFKFQPKDERERDDVQEIIKLFRFHMAPELQPGNMRFLGIPATFDIHYMYQTSDNWESGSMDWRNARENDFYNKIATCVLTNVSVDYTPEGVRSFHDGSPTQITMDLSFSETELLTKDKINIGY